MGNSESSSVNPLKKFFRDRRKLTNYSRVGQATFEGMYGYSIKECIGSINHQGLVGNGIQTDDETVNHKKHRVSTFRGKLQNNQYEGFGELIFPHPNE